MSKKYRNKKRKKQEQSKKPLIWLVSGGVFLIAAALFMVFGGNDSDGGTPALVVDQEVIEYGDVKFDTNLTFEIKVTNTGDGNLKFKETPYIQVREGC
ncbi:MAG: hypothetical protein HN736_10900 [Anaerolineae bacterium]|jgi:hypothetical protein|nr:hypothetical protein [Anaerolineae bacterium]MBT4309607.1 hypothetical protein [Anaerolineae bacterium]MBT4456970.1 hypothetical protein [Anaerolineae bacterium]MBT4843244.1 hypothetical protein [Anaerolineae bacterium]MBT6060671.1 hypothetical protein [Anaerolineae bacterium]